MIILLHGGKTFMGNYICMYSEGEKEKYLYKYLKHLQDTKVVGINIKHS